VHTTITCSRARRGTAGQQRRKLEAVHAYGTQLGELDAMAFAPLHRSLRYGVVWELVPT
jgi:hypothetical protein